MLLNFKKISAIALSAMLALSVTACGKDAPEAEQTVSETTAVTEAPEAVSARITVDGTKFMVNGKEWWSNGVNTPWHKWNDFSGQMDEEHWDKTFALLAENNINILDISQTIVQEYFNMMMIVDFAKTGKDFLVAANELEQLGESIGVIIKAQREDIFDMMHRI